MDQPVDCHGMSSGGRAAVLSGDGDYTAIREVGNVAEH